MGLPGPGGPPGPPGEDGDKVSCFHACVKKLNITGEIGAIDPSISLNALWGIHLMVLTSIIKS